MWKCKNCSEQVDDSFDNCWNCGSSRDGKAPGEWKKEEIKEDTSQNRPAINSPTQRQEVVVVDVRMPFWSIVVFMVKWAFASIPAFLIVFVLAFLFGNLLGAIGVVFSR